MVDDVDAGGRRVVGCTGAGLVLVGVEAAHLDEVEDLTRSIYLIRSNLCRTYIRQA